MASDLAIWVPLGAAMLYAIPQTFMGMAAYFNARDGKEAAREAAGHAAEAAATASKAADIIQGNGRGDVAKMLEKSLSWQEAHEIEDRQQFAALHTRLEEISASTRSDTHRDPGHSGKARSAD